MGNLSWLWEESAHVKTGFCFYWWSKSVEGLLSTRPTLSSFFFINICALSILVFHHYWCLGSIWVTGEHTDGQKKGQTPIIICVTLHFMFFFFTICVSSKFLLQYSFSFTTSCAQIFFCFITGFFFTNRVLSRILFHHLLSLFIAIYVS